MRRRMRFLPSTGAAAIGVAALLLPCPPGRSAAAATQAPPSRVVVVARNLANPVHVTAPVSEPDRLYVVQQSGLVRVLVRGRLQSQNFLDLRSRVALGGERGLLSIAFSPRYATDRRLYAFYTDREALNVIELREEGGRVDPATARQLLRVPHEDGPFHNGGQLAFGPDGLLYAGFGDGGYIGREPDPHGNSQNLDVLLGKLVRLDPFSPAPRAEVVAYGLRNPWRFSFDAATGDLVIGDVGWFDFEEVNVLPAGTKGLVNFGWSVYEGRRRTRRPGEPVELNPRGALTWPVYAYPTGARGNCSIVGGFVYHGRRVTRLRGRYVFGDYCSGRIWSARLAGDRATDVRAEDFRLTNLVSFGQDAAGELYAVTICALSRDGQRCRPRTGVLYRFVR
jgi:glucose/arabinose dehydrogenase